MTDKGARILVVDDELQIRKLLRISLSAHGYEVEEARNGQEAVSMAAAGKPELVILDLGLPDMDGKEVVRRIREWSQVPIIVLSAREQEQEKVDALDAGADDYITKPFGVGELMARMRVSIRRSVHAEGEPVLRCGDLAVDAALRRVTVGGREVRLTPKEYDLLKELIQYAGKVLTHRHLLKTVWGDAYTDDSQYVRVYIGQLRRKIEEDPAQPRYIVSEPGVGYRLLGR